LLEKILMKEMLQDLPLQAYDHSVISSMLKITTLIWL
jgi:hypothetical protein